MEEELAEARSKAGQDVESAAAQAATLQSQLDDRAAELSQQASRMEGLERQLEGALAEVQQLQARLAEVGSHAQRTMPRLSVELNLPWGLRRHFNLYKTVHFASHTWHHRLKSRWR